MTPDELRAAAEQLIAEREHRHESYRIAKRHGWKAPPEDETDGERLARAYLAEHPADDGDAVTMEWLRSIGFATAAEACGVAASLGRIEAFSVLPQPLQWRVNGFKVSEKPTRGDVRRLLAALGIPTGGQS